MFFQIQTIVLLERLTFIANFENNILLGCLYIFFWHTGHK